MLGGKIKPLCISVGLWKVLSLTSTQILPISFSIHFFQLLTSHYVLPCNSWVCNAMLCRNIWSRIEPIQNFPTKLLHFQSYGVPEVPLALVLTALLQSITSTFWFFPSLLANLSTSSCIFGSRSQPSSWRSKCHIMSG